MTLLALWDEMYSAAPRGRDGRVVRRVRPDSSLDAFAVLELSARAGETRRAIELRVEPSAVSEVDAPTSTRMVHASIEPRDDGRSALVLRLEHDGAREIFAAMGADVLRATADAASQRAAVLAWLGRFAKWRRMLQSAGRGLGPERQRGLFGELLFLRDTLVPAVGFDEAVRAWIGADGAPRDFELRGLGVEVKTSAANEPHIVAINGERQLDDTGLRRLTLVHFSLEVLRDSEQSLPKAVETVRDMGAHHAEAGLLEDRLLQCGYIDEHADLYRRAGYALRRSSHFRIHDGFPRIIEGDLRDGIGAVKYRLAVDACRNFEVPIDEFTALLENQ